MCGDTNFGMHHFTLSTSSRDTSCVRLHFLHNHVFLLVSYNKDQSNANTRKGNSKIQMKIAHK